MSPFQELEWSDGAHERTPACSETLGSRATSHRLPVGAVHRALARVNLDESRPAAVPPSARLQACHVACVACDRSAVRGTVVPATLGCSHSYRFGDPCA